MTVIADLQAILAMAYRAKAMGQGSSVAALDRFRERRDDPAFMEAAQAELARVTAVPNARCYVSKCTMEFLQEALR